MATSQLKRVVSTTVLLAPMVYGGAVVARDIAAPHNDRFQASWNQTEFNHGLWTSALHEHVDDKGLVDYSAIGRDIRYLEYLHRLANTNPAGLANDQERLAFWINAYNALAIQGVLATLPNDETTWHEYSVLRVEVPGVEKKGKGFFEGLTFKVGNQRYSLDEIEKNVILQKPPHDKADIARYRAVGTGRPDPRIHFALVCCAQGCPLLRREAYTANAVETQLADAVRMFLKDLAKARFDLARRTVYLSQLFDWYRGDLTDRRYSPSAATVLEFLSPYVSDPTLARSVSTGQWSIRYTDYDWALNLKR